MSKPDAGIVVNCSCGGVSGKSVILQPVLDLPLGVTLWYVKCRKCKKEVKTKTGQGFRSCSLAVRKWGLANGVAPTPKAWCRTIVVRDGRMFTERTNVLEAWTALNAGTGEVDLSQLEQFEDQLPELVDGWKRQKFNLVQA